MPTPIDNFKDGIPKVGVSRSFVNNVRLRIQAQMRVKVRTEQRRGRINKRALIRPVLPPVDGGKWNAKIFFQREEAQKINTAVTVLVDVSGSMGGSKIQHASQAACLLTNVLSRALKVPTEVLAFTFSNKVRMGIVKPFDRVSTTDEEIAGGVYSTYRRGGGGNDDANALLFAYDRLIKRKEAKKILIVLSDGCPADSVNRGCADDGLKMVTDSIRKRGLVNLYGIGIMDTNVKRYYGANAHVIKSAEELEHALVDTLSQTVFIESDG